MRRTHEFVKYMGCPTLAHHSITWKASNAARIHPLVLDGSEDALKKRMGGRAMRP